MWATVGWLGEKGFHFREDFSVPVTKLESATHAQTTCEVSFQEEHDFSALDEGSVSNCHMEIIYESLALSRS